MSDTTFKHHGLTVTIAYDEDCGSPRTEYDNVGKMVCFHKRYDLGDKHDYRFGDYNSWSEMEAAIREDNDVAVLLWLGLYDHSGISMYIGGGSAAGDPGGWDSGTVGLIFCTKAQVQYEWGGDVEKAESYLRGEVETYDQYLQNDVWCYAIEDEEGNILDSLCGIYGDDYCMEEAKAAAESIAAERAKADVECYSYMAV